MLQTSLKSVFCLIILAGFSSQHAWSDVLVLKSGGRLEGNVEVLASPPSKPDKADKPADADEANNRKFYRITLNNGVRLAFAYYDVKQHLQESGALAEYRKRAAEAGNSAPAHWEIAKWCRTQSMQDRAQLHVERVVELDPDNGVARAWLDQVKYQGRWIPKDQMQRLRGMVFRDGQWQIPETAVVNEQTDKTKAAVRIWTTNLKKLRKDANSSRFGARALAELRAVTDPLAAEGVDVLMRETPNETLEMKQLYMDLFSQWDNPATIDALVRISVTEEPRVRERAIDMLREKAPGYGAMMFTRMLKDRQNIIVERAAVALARMPQHDTIPYLIDALNTRHMPEDVPAAASGGTSINSSFSPQGSGAGSFGFGSKKPQPVDLQNRSVLSALISLAPEGSRYQFDEAAWLRWYAQRAEYGYDLRRDP